MDLSHLKMKLSYNGISIALQIGNIQLQMSQIGRHMDQIDLH